MILFAALAMGAFSLVLGVLLCLAGMVFKTEEDPRLEAIIEALPGANCGGCGMPGCANFASALLQGKVKPNGCPVGGEELVDVLSEISGMIASVSEKMTAFVACGGNSKVRSTLYEYTGIGDCHAAYQLAAHGFKNCEYGCLGVGSCKHVCEFDAINIINDIAVINEEKCVACQKCVHVCPKRIIKIVPLKSRVRVVCSSLDLAKTVRANCKNGCIGCKLCEKACEYSTVSVNQNLATINYSKCPQCKACATKCPAKCISVNGTWNFEQS